MGRAIAIGVCIFLAVSGLLFVLSDNIRTGLVANHQLETATSTPATTYFSASGVIDYYPNNVGTQIPYLVYETMGSTTAAKALIYCNVPAGHYSGSVHIEGYVEDESICVDSITPA